MCSKRWLFSHLASVIRTIQRWWECDEIRKDLIKNGKDKEEIDRWFAGYYDSIEEQYDKSIPAQQDKAVVTYLNIIKESLNNPHTESFWRKGDIFDIAETELARLCTSKKYMEKNNNELWLDKNTLELKTIDYELLNVHDIVITYKIYTTEGVVYDSAVYNHPTNTFNFESDQKKYQENKANYDFIKEKFQILLAEEGFPISDNIFISDLQYQNEKWKIIWWVKLSGIELVFEKNSSSNKFHFWVLKQHHNMDYQEIMNCLKEKKLSCTISSTHLMQHLRLLKKENHWVQRALKKVKPTEEKLFVERLLCFLNKNIEDNSLFKKEKKALRQA